MTETIRNFIDGELVESATSDVIELVDPTTGEVDGRSPVSTAEVTTRTPHGPSSPCRACG